MKAELNKFEKIIKNYYNKMGASLVYLNEPNTEIEHETGENEFL
jgi:hypothetical protein